MILSSVIQRTRLLYITLVFLDLAVPGMLSTFETHFEMLSIG